jgi:hypothetical protein
MKTSHVLTIAAAAAVLAGCARWHENIQGAEPITFNELPPAAQATVRNEIGTQPITSITRQYEFGEPSFRVEVEQSGLNPSLWVAQDGSIIKESRRLVSANQQQYVQPSYQMNEAAGAQAQPMQDKRPLPTGKHGSSY